MSEKGVGKDPQQSKWLGINASQQAMKGQGDWTALSLVFLPRSATVYGKSRAILGAKAEFVISCNFHSLVKPTNKVLNKFSQ